MTEPARRSVAVVTGGSAGLGRAAVREFAARGYDVAVLARGADGLIGAVADVGAAGGRGLGVPTDVAEWAQVDEAVSRVENELGPIDVWVNNSMASVFAPFMQMTPAEFERATRTTYLGVVHGTRAALQHMRPRDRGVVVQVGSALAYRGIPLQSAYCGAKHAIVGFTESVRTELRHDGSGVRIAMVHMPALNTPQFGWVRSRLRHHPQPVPPIFQPEVGARAIVDVAEHPRRSAWVGLPTAGTILANRLVPGLLDRYLARTGYQSQQSTDDPNPMLGDNLYRPVSGDHGAHGDFDDDAKPHAVLTGIRGRNAAALAGTAVAAAGAVLARRLRTR